MRLWLAARVNRRWPLLASVIILGPERFLAEQAQAIQEARQGVQASRAVLEAIQAQDEAPEPSRGKVGSRPEDLEPLDPYGFQGRRSGW